jgi:CRP/FNR family cyclic AMP-dependent transcriptional regulator
MIDALTIKHDVEAVDSYEALKLVAGRASMGTGELLKKLRGPQGRTPLVECIKAQSLVRGEQELAQALADLVRVEEVPFGTAVIVQGSSNHDLIFIFAGDFFVIVGRQVITRRTAGQYVGEMALIDPDAPRSATVTSGSDAVIARISEPDFSALADRFPSLWRRLAQELAARLRRATTQSRYGKPTDCAA